MDILPGLAGGVGLWSMNSDFREGKWPEIMIHFRSSLLSMPSIRLQDFVLFSWIVKSLHSFHFMNKSGFMQYLNFESQHNLFLLQWVVESQAPANKAHEPPGFIFHSLPLHWVLFLFGDFFPLFISWAQLYNYICSCYILNGTFIYLKWEGRFPGWLSPAI